MKNQLYILISTILLSGMAFGQSIRDTVFNDVIPIHHQYVTTDGTDFLIDILIKPQKEPIVIVNHDRRIPLELFFDRKSFLSEQNEIILIEDGLLRVETKETEKWAPSLKIYHIDRIKTKVDSLVYNWVDINPVKLDYKKTTLKEKEVKYYYFNCFELKSRHTFDDTQLALDSLNTLYNIYEGLYSSYAGKGSSNSFSCDFYILSSLPFDKKLFVIKEMDKLFKTNPDNLPKIFMPITLR